VPGLQGRVGVVRGQQLLATAQADGCIRAAIDAGTLLKLAHGIAVAAGGSAGTASRLADLVMDGLRTRPEQVTGTHGTPS
jgi:hypothetical protein